MPKNTVVAPSILPVPSPVRPDSVDAPVRLRLLIAALTVLRRDPYAAFTQAQVAAEAGVRQSHLTYYFPTRNDLLRAVVEAARDEAAAHASSPEAHPRERRLSLRALRDRLCSPGDSPALPRLMVALTTASDEDESLRPWLAAFEEDNKVRIEVAFAALGLRVRAVSLDVFHATLVGAALLSFQQRTPTASRRAARTCRMAFDRLVADADGSLLP